ncbi:hypothetical protein Tco_1089690 [Tanacetum coccineum]
MYMQQPMLNLEDISDPTTAINMELVRMAKAFKLNYSTPSNNNQRISSNPRNRQIAQPSIQNVGNQNGLIVILGIDNQNVNRNGNGNIVAARSEGNGNGNRNNGNHGILMRLRKSLQTAFGWLILHQASTSGTQTDKAPVYDSDRSAENDSNVISAVSSVEQCRGTVEQNPTTVKETADESLAKHKASEYEIERLLKALVSQDIMSIVQSNSVVDTSNLQTELDPHPDTSNSVPTTKESKVMNNDKIIAPGMFRINPFKIFREDKFVPINQAIESIKTNLITVSQPHVITKQDVSSDSKGLSSTGVDNTTKTRRPQPRSNTKNDWVSSASKSSCIKNKEVEVEEHHRNLLLSKNKKHMSSECNNIKFAIQNDKSKVVCAMCKKCLITSNHDVCVLNYVNDMSSHVNNFSANVSKSANQKKHK